MIYFIQVSEWGPIKIGFTQDELSLELRLATLQGSSAWPLVLRAICSGDRRLEHALHLYYTALRMKGEWFIPSEELLALVKFVSEQPADAYEKILEICVLEYAALGDEDISLLRKMNISKRKLVQQRQEQRGEDVPNLFPWN